MLELSASTGCPSPCHISCFPEHLTVSSQGPDCGFWPFRFHNPHGLLSAWSHLSTWLNSAGGRRVFCRSQFQSWGYFWQHSSSTPRCFPSQCPWNSVEGKPLHGWLSWWLQHLVRSQATSWERHHVPSARSQFGDLTFHFRHRLRGLSGAETFQI